LAQAGLPTLTPAEQQQLYEVTHGNPALVTLLITLWRTGEPIALAQLGHTPSVELLLNRIWKRLPDDECAILMALAVFRSFAPQDAWPAEQAVINQLLERELLTRDERGGIALLPSIREFVYQRTPADLKIILHGAAAQIRDLRGEYTAAAYHYIAAHQPAIAVWVWFTHRTQEIERGRATTARALFKTVAFSDLPDDEDRRALALLRAELFKLVGAAEEAESELLAVTWPRTHPITPYAQQLHGEVLEVQEGRYAQALERYREGLQLLGGAAQLREVDLLIRQGYVYLVHLRDLTRAKEEALLARLNAEEFCGTVAEEAGDYVAAHTYYEVALAIAKNQENNLRLLARVHSHLGRLTWRQGDAVTAIEHLEQAIQCEAARGNIVGVLHDRVNLSGAYIIAGRYGDALTQAQAGLAIAESLRHTYLIAGLASNAGEACYYLNQPDLAEQYAMQSLYQEEDVHRPYALTVLGLVQQAQKHFGLAERSLRSAIESAQTIRDKYAEAAAWRALACCYRDQQNRPQSSLALEAALRLYCELGLTQEATVLQTELETL
jgi:tetratricopeptide (TPR) repeat protein